MTKQDNDKRIDYIEFRSTDIPRTKAFYQAAFGWRFTDYGEEYVSFEDGRLGGGFHLADAVVTGGPLIVLYAKDLEAMASVVEGAGGTIDKPIFEFPGGRRFEFRDPCGNALAVWSE